MTFFFFFYCRSCHFPGLNSSVTFHYHQSRIQTIRHRQCGVMLRSMASGARQPVFILHVVVLGSWAHFLTPLCLSFSIVKNLVRVPHRIVSGFNRGKTVECAWHVESSAVLTITVEVYEVALCVSLISSSPFLCLIHSALAASVSCSSEHCRLVPVSGSLHFWFLLFSQIPLWKMPSFYSGPSFCN